MTPQELKLSILQLAIQGKLVEQCPEEGTGEELFKQIQAEKQALIKAGKLKKEKPMSEITEEEIQFDIPATWSWIRLGELIRVIGGISYKKGDVSKSGIRILRGGNIQSMKVLTGEDDVFLPYEYRDDEKQVRLGDILIVASTGSKTVIGKPGYVDKEMPDTMIGAFLRICRPLCLETVEYLCCLFESDFYRKHIRDLSQGTNINNVKESYITEFVIPLPPLAEQKRIVAKIEELLPLIDRYEQAWSKLEDFNKRFPVDMQKSILQMAIQGKLVEQRPEEGTGEELFQQIQAEKQRLIKEGKIKKERPLPEITEDEIPFDLPESWKWVRVGDIFNVGTGMTPLKTEVNFYQNGTIPWVTSSLTSQRYIVNAETNITEYALENTSLTVYPAHTLIVAMYGQGKTRGQVSELLIDATINQACAALGNIVMEESLISYVYYCFLFNYEVLRKKAEGTSQPNLNLGKIKETLIPLPPLAEQKRIVAKLEEILPLCERLK